jgi:hypothetical protein
MMQQNANLSCSFKKSGTVEKVLFDFDVKELYNNVDDIEDEGEPLKRHRLRRG